MGFFKKALGFVRKAAAIALPVAGSIIGGPVGGFAGGAAGGLLEGKGVKGALKAGAFSAATTFIGGKLSSAAGIGTKLASAATGTGALAGAARFALTPIGKFTAGVLATGAVKAASKGIRAQQAEGAPATSIKAPKGLEQGVDQEKNTAAVVSSRRRARLGVLNPRGIFGGGQGLGPALLTKKTLLGE